MTTPLKAQRYLLRDGKFITASIRLDPDHVYRYVCQNGSVIFALLSAQDANTTTTKGTCKYVTPKITNVFDG
ncbi:hypothetical protein [Synechococcus sp. ROS8604]|uniref:hypothetical protein n=1 Tax=Synechococcus sp. ROS8604 TaxID=1442557 RepID=UPI00164947B5|nr:hypothetical protein [Synechococcus sp. ROS8604]QNI89391.1 hypothetical protein SynROS8604_02768 [Synechococcus sp. ROS8604]